MCLVFFIFILLQKFYCVFILIIQRLILSVMTQKLGLRCMDTRSFVFPSYFTKGNNFLDLMFASLVDKALPNVDLLLKERICSYGSKFFRIRVDLSIKGKQI